jgi:pyruvate,water dikinase
MTASPAADDRLAAPRYVLATAECRAEHLSEVGGKAVGLGRLLRAGQRVPRSFVVAATAYREYVQGHPIGAGGAGTGTGPDTEAGAEAWTGAGAEAEAGAEAGAGAKAGAGAEAGGAGPGAEFRRSVARSYTDLSGGSGSGGGGIPVAVRSSATMEDSADASGAGQFMTFLGARGAQEVLARIEQCWMSASAPQVESYRSQRGLDAAGQSVAVIVQELVDARTAGVMFTQHPRTGDRSVVVIESSYGLGEAVVGGEVSPDLLEINKITGQITQRSLGTKAAEYRLAAGGHQVERRPVDPQRQRAWSITEAEAAALVAMAAELEAALGRGLDVEWAIGAVPSGGPGESLFALQVRPITVDSAAPGPGAAPAGSGIDLILGRLSGHQPGGRAQ